MPDTNFKCFEFGTSPILEEQRDISKNKSLAFKTVHPTPENIDAFLANSPLYDTATKRWTGAPKDLQSNALCKPFTLILDTIIKYFDLPSARIPEKIRQIPFESEETTSRTKLFLPTDLEAHQVVKEDYILNCAQLYARNALRTQPSRFFVSCLFISDTSLKATLFVFARDGLHHTSEINLHHNASTFIQIALGASSKDNNWAGCDSCVYWQADSELPYHPPNATPLENQDVPSEYPGIYCCSVTPVRGYTSSLKFMDTIWKPVNEESDTTMDVDTKSDAKPMVVCENSNELHLDSEAMPEDTAEDSEIMEVNDLPRESTTPPANLKRISEELEDDNPQGLKKSKTN